MTVKGENIMSFNEMSCGDKFLFTFKTDLSEF